jgi:hypothetical protein
MPLGGLLILVCLSFVVFSLTFIFILFVLLLLFFLFDVGDKVFLLAFGGRPRFLFTLGDGDSDTVSSTFFSMPPALEEDARRLSSLLDTIFLFKTFETFEAFFKTFGGRPRFLFKTNGGAGGSGKLSSVAAAVTVAEAVNVVEIEVEAVTKGNDDDDT